MISNVKNIPAPGSDKPGENVTTTSGVNSVLLDTSSVMTQTENGNFSWRKQKCIFLKNYDLEDQLKTWTSYSANETLNIYIFCLFVVILFKFVCKFYFAEWRARRGGLSVTPSAK